MNKFEMKLTEKMCKGYGRMCRKNRDEIIDQYCRRTGTSCNLESK